jgi:AraC-like DNA-binding protein
VSRTFSIDQSAYADVERPWNCALREEFPGSRARIGPLFASASFSIAGLRDAVVTDISSGPQHVTSEPSQRWRRMVSVVLQLSGEARVRHRGSVARLCPGAFVLVDTDHPLSLEFRGPYRQVFVLVPSARVGSLGLDAFGRSTNSSSPIDRLLVDNVRGLLHATPLMDARQQSLALDALVALVRLSSPVTGAQLSGRRIERAVMFIDERLGDPELSARSVADAQGVSRRFLDELFRAAGTTTERMIWERRLQRASSLLSQDDSKGVLEVALEVGFTSASHFARAYRSRFGRTPSADRRS